MGLDPGGLVAVRNFAPVEPFLIASIQPVGSGTEVHLVDGQPMTVGAVPPQQGALTSGGVPWELVRRFLGQRFTRQELTEERVKFLHDERLAYQWQGQVFFLVAVDSPMPLLPLPLEDLTGTPETCP
jgi:hypothetical protein